MKVTKCFWKWPAIIRQQQAELDQLRRAQSQLVKWVMVTHRLDSPESNGIKALFQAGKRLVPILALLLMTTLSFGQAPPIIRQPVTTNFWFGVNPTEGGVPTWNAAAAKWSNNVPSGAGTPHVWTNDNGVIRPIDFPTNIMLRPNVADNGIGTNFHFDTSVRRTNSHSKIFQIYNGGSNAVTIGPDGGIFIGRGNTALFPGVVLYGIYDTAIGETNQQEIFIQSKNSAVGIGYNGSADLIVDTNYGALILTALKEDGVKFSRFAISAGAGINPENFNTFSMQALVDNATYFQVDPNFTLLTPTNYLFSSSVRITNIHTLMSLQNSNFPVFEVDGVGDLKLLKKVPYSWPSAQGAAGTALTNNGAGVLGWWPISLGGGSGLTTNQNQFLGVPLSIKSAALLTNTVTYSGTNFAAATNDVAITVVGLTGQNTNLTEWHTPHGTIASFVKSNGSLMLPAGVASFPSIGWAADDDGTGTGLYRQGANNVGVSINGSLTFRVAAGEVDVGNNPITFGSAPNTFDMTLARDGPAILSHRFLANPMTNRVYRTVTGTAAAQMTNAAWTEVANDTFLNAARISSMADGSNQSFLPLIVAINTNSIALRVETNGVIVLSNAPSMADASLRISQTNGRGYSEFTVTNSVIATNRFVWSFGSNTVAASQVAKVHSTTISGGINTIVLTNDADSGGGTVAFSDLVWTNDVGKIYPRVDQDRIAFYTNIILGRLIRADGTNTALGSNAAMPGFGGEKNTAVGTDALSIAGGTENSAFGHRAAISNSSGSFNVAIGSLAMEANEFRSDNTAVGYNSLRQFITGGQNTAIGSGTMDLLASSTDGTALGWGALDKMEGSGNTALGSQAMLNAEGGGNYNVAVGYEAFEGSDRLEANVVLGRGAMAGATDLTNIIAIGYQANSSSIGITNAVAIGANTRLITNNQMVFGTNITLYTFRNVMYGFPTAQGANSTALTNDGSGNLGWWPISVGGGNVNFSDLVWTNDASIPAVRIVSPTSTNVTRLTAPLEIRLSNEVAGLTVIGTNDAAQLNQVTFQNLGPSINSESTFRFADHNGGSLAKLVARMMGTNTATSGRLSFQTRNVGSLANRMVIETNGWVSIGANPPRTFFDLGTTTSFQVDADGNARSGPTVITNLPGMSDPFLRISHTNLRGYTDFTITNSVISTNRLVWSIGSNTVAASQVLKIHSTDISDGVNSIVLTNDTDQTGGGTSFITNADYRTVVVSNATAYGRAPMLPKDSFFFDSFDYPTRRGNTEWDGQIAYGTVTYTARQAGGGDHPGMNTNGYLVVTNNGSGSARALYLAVTNIATNEIGGFEKPKYITRLRSEFIPADYLNQGGGGDLASQVVLAHVTSINANPDAWIATGGGGANTRGTNVLHCVFAPAAKTLDIGYFTNGLSGAVLIAQTNLSGYFSYNQPTVWETLIFTNKLLNIINGHVIDTPYTITGAPGGHLATNYVATFELLTSDRTTNEAYNILLDNISAGWVDQDVKISEVYDAGVTNSTAISMKGPAPNTKIKTVSAGFNTTLTDNGGTNLTISSSASVGVYRTIYVDAAGMVPGATLGAQFDTSEQFAPTNRMTDSYLFSDSVSNIVQFKLAFPMEWDLSTIKYKIFYSSTNASATATNVWQVEATAISHDDPMDANWGTGITITNKITAANDLLLTGASAPLTVGGTPVAQDLVWFRIKRMGAAADDADTGQSKLLGIWLQYKEATNSVAIW